MQRRTSDCLSKAVGSESQLSRYREKEAPVPGLKSPSTMITSRRGEGWFDGLDYRWPSARNVDAASRFGRQPRSEFEVVATPLQLAGVVIRDWASRHRRMRPAQSAKIECMDHHFAESDAISAKSKRASRRTSRGRTKGRRYFPKILIPLPGKASQRSKWSVPTRPSSPRCRGPPVSPVTMGKCMEVLVYTKGNSWG